jgi:acyl-CoA thioesterase
VDTVLGMIKDTVSILQRKAERQRVRIRKEEEMEDQVEMIQVSIG